MCLRASSTAGITPRPMAPSGILDETGKNPAANNVTFSFSLDMRASALGEMKDVWQDVAEKCGAKHVDDDEDDDDEVDVEVEEEEEDAPVEEDVAVAVDGEEEDEGDDEEGILACESTVKREIT